MNQCFSLLLIASLTFSVADCAKRPHQGDDEQIPRKRSSMAIKAIINSSDQRNTMELQELAQAAAFFPPHAHPQTQSTTESETEEETPLHTDRIHIEHQNPVICVTEESKAQPNALTLIDHDNLFDFFDHDHYIASDYPQETMYNTNDEYDVAEYQAETINQHGESLAQDNVLNYNENHDDIDQYFQMPSENQPIQPTQQACVIQVNPPATTEIAHLDTAQTIDLNVDESDDSYNIFQTLTVGTDDNQKGIESSSQHESLYQETVPEDDCFDVDAYFQIPSENQTLQLTQQAQVSNDALLDDRSDDSYDILDSEEHNSADTIKINLDTHVTQQSDVPLLIDPNTLSLNNHNKQKKFKCTYHGCTYVCAYKQNLYPHMRTHTGEKPHMCAHHGCDKVFSDISNLTEHMKIHTGERPFKCTHPGCDKAFAKKSNLNCHMRTHTGERPFKCTYPGCDAAFSHKSAFNNHMRIHTHEKAFKCTYQGCDKTFARSAHLNSHVKNKHTVKNYSYACTSPGCPEKFFQQSDLKSHVQYHEEHQRKFKCNKCTFSNNSKLRFDRHMKLHENVSKKQ